MIILPPLSRIGILGGGQLGRMTALAAARLGYHTHVFCPSMDEPAVEVATQATIAHFNDKAALVSFAEQVDVITLEWENVPVEALDFLATLKPVYPGAPVLKVAQDRVAEKTFARSLGLSTADFVSIETEADLVEALVHFPRPAILKSNRNGYDGKGQVRITPTMTAAEAWAAVGGVPSILEGFVDFSCEISVIVACRADGASATYPAVENIHKEGILAETHAPANLPTAIIQEAEHMARTLAERLGVVGLLAVEMFVRRVPGADGKYVVMNEIAPRPHNSGHWTMDACACDQFEQLVRAVCGLPLGSTLPHSRAVMVNLIGQDAESWHTYLTTAQDCLHLYGKKEIRNGRKMGHVNRLGGAWDH